ncbi:hypothetical protein MMA231_03506 (plasmid) [Asticcacaulis sp. MM231]|uniref:TonB-dependent receptor n=1 Tax=Asticcacaulis sp. MM231 TaxID=3157666 RepID=UPI0032D5A4A1
MITSTKKSGLLTGTASMAVLAVLSLSGMAHAQDAAAPAPAADETIVVVTGQRAQLKSSQKIKKDLDVIVNSVTAVDIGALPDRSVADALQRISGVTIQRAAEANDPIRMTAEAGGVEIRGLQWVRSETNGRDIFSAKNGRGLSWGDVSADLLAGVDVYKNASADMIEGGIGGTVNLRTRLPFDQKKPIMAFSVDATEGDLQKKNHYSASAIYSNRWDTSIGEIGALLNYSLVSEGNMTNVIAVDRYNQVGDKLIPNTMGWRTIEWNQKRTAINGALQWRPSDDLEFTLSVLNAKAEPKNTEYNVGFYNDSSEFSSADSMATYQYDSNGVFKSGTVKNAGITSNTRYGEDHNETTDVSLHGRWNVNDKLTLAGDVQYVRSTANVLSNTAFLQIANKVDASIDISGDLPVIGISSPNTTADPSTYWWSAAMDHIEKNQGKEIAARIDGDYEIDAGWLKSFKFGVRTTDKDYITRQSTYNWGFLSAQYWGNAGNTEYATDTGSGTYDIRDFSNFMNGDVPVPGTVVFPDASVVNQGTAATAAMLASANTSGWGWSPLQDFTGGTNGNGLNSQNEKTTAGYITAKFGGEVNGHILDGNFGVRVVETKSDGESYIYMAVPTTAQPCVTNCDVYNDVFTFTGGNGNPFFQSYGGSHKYTNTLPSLNVRLKWSDQLQFRFAASKGMVRPDLAWLSPYTALSSSFTLTTAGELTDYQLTGSGGNPDLKPIEANQYDLTAEWYFSPTGSFTVDLFKKDLSNYIYNGTQTETYTNNGITLDFEVARRFNGSVEGKAEGFEVAYQQFYDFLPAPFNGLGVQANYTHINSSGGRNSGATDGSALNALPLEGMSPDSYNAALMYEKYGISARLAYNWRSKYLYTTSAANVNRPLWSDDYGQLDGSIFYTINANYKIGVQAVNLGHSTTKQLVSSDLTNPLETQWYSAIKTDRRISVVLRATY